MSTSTNLAFLRGCHNNFKTDKENVDLLIHGYIPKKSLMIPSDIADMIGKYYLFLGEFYHKETWITNFFNDELEIDDTRTTLKYFDFIEEEVGCHYMITPMDIRKLWKIKVNSNRNTFKIGLTNNANHFLLSIENGKVVPSNILIKKGDILSILYYRKSNEQSELKYAVNNKICERSFKFNILNCRAMSLKVILFDAIELQIIN